MAEIAVVPDTFSLVLFDAATIAAVAGRVADDVGFPPDTTIRIEVDERVPLGRSRLVSLEPIVIQVESGAFENAREPRHLSERSVASVMSRLLLRARDRLDPAFGPVPPDAELSLAEHVAWDAYAVARAGRLGYPAQKQRRLYHFRIRHGFTDEADAAFERLWSADHLTWSDIETLSAETLAAKPPAA